MSVDACSALAQRILDLEATARASGALEERRRVITLLSTMWWNPEYFGEPAIAVIDVVVHELIRRISDPREGVNPFPTNEALVLLDAGGPWETPRFARERDV